MRIISCPLCHKDMEIVNVGKVEIDKCTECNGIWLDKGELEQLAEQERERIIESIKLGEADFLNILDMLLGQLFPTEQAAAKQ